jgi:hypothetical protein
VVDPHGTSCISASASADGFHDAFLDVFLDVLNDRRPARARGESEPRTG